MTRPQPQKAWEQPRMVFRAHRPWARPPCILLKTRLEGRCLLTSRSQSQWTACYESCCESLEREQLWRFLKRLDNQEERTHLGISIYIYLDNRRALSDDTKIRWERWWLIKNRNEQPQFKAQSSSKIVPERESLSRQTQWVSYPFFFYFHLFPCSVRKSWLWVKLYF